MEVLMRGTKDAEALREDVVATSLLFVQRQRKSWHLLFND